MVGVLALVPVQPRPDLLVVLQPLLDREDEVKGVVGQLPPLGIERGLEPPAVELAPLIDGQMAP